MMRLMNTMTAAERQAIAADLGISEQYLYQCLTGRKHMKPEEAVRLELESAGAIQRWHVRTSDWHLIWPELRSRPDAPALPKKAVA